MQLGVGRVVVVHCVVMVSRIKHFAFKVLLGVRSLTRFEALKKGEQKWKSRWSKMTTRSIRWILSCHTASESTKIPACAAQHTIERDLRQHRSLDQCSVSYLILPIVNNLLFNNRQNQIYEYYLAKSNHHSNINKILPGHHTSITTL